MPDGTRLKLAALAGEICHRYSKEFPDEAGRYGEAGPAWCRHDNQHILNWAILDLRGLVDFDKELTWLSGVLEAREFPTERLARDLELASVVVGERVSSEDSDALAERLAAGASLIRSELLASKAQPGSWKRP